MSPLRWFFGAHILAFIVWVPLSGCTTTPQGKSLDRSNYADLGSTALGLSQGAVEANPFGAILIPFKLGMGYLAENAYQDDCVARADFAGTTNSFFYGASANNLVVAGGLALGMNPVAAPLVGIAGGIAYWFKKEELEPETYACHGEGPLSVYVAAYNDGNADSVADSFIPMALTTDAVGRSQIASDYAEIFSNQEYRMQVITQGDGMAYVYVTDADGGEGVWRFDYEIQGGKLASLFHRELTDAEFDSLEGFKR